MRVALAQIKSLPGKIELNTRNILRKIHKAAASGCDLAIFPEMSDTGYDMAEIVRSASGWDGGPYAAIADAAAETHLSVIAGLSERVDDVIYNSTAVIGPDGQLVARYRKIHLITAEPVCEQNYIRAGEEFTLCTLGGFRVGLLTCYDIRFPEMARLLSLAGAEILVVTAAFPKVRVDHWKTLNACRAIENQVYLAAVNRVGVDNGLAFCGSSGLFDPCGTLVVGSSETEETLLVGEITKDRLIEVRDRMKVYRDRRGDLYERGVDSPENTPTGT